MPEVLVLYYSRKGSTAALARLVARGIEEVPGVTARLRTVPPVRSADEPPLAAVPDDGPPYATLSDLTECAGVALGSPTRFGAMAAPLKHFIDSTGSLWVSGALVGKPAAVFTSTSTPHGGQESTLLALMLPLLHHGMLLVGVPFTEPEIHQTDGGGSPYGAGHLADAVHGAHITDDERNIARVLGRRLAETVARLAG